jgi:phosphoribosylaminoimidazole-succinocarboxamide synthase
MDYDPRGAMIGCEIPGLPPPRRGKVRDVFDLGDRLLLVASDRISAFDVVMPNGIPDKGRVLTGLSLFWFNRFPWMPNHLLTADVDEFPASLKPYRDDLRGRAMLVRKVAILPIECIVRGYLVGSGWKEYQKAGTVCGLPLRPGYAQAEKLDAPIFTPSTKAEQGAHDENIPFATMAELVGQAQAEEAREKTLAFYAAAAEHAATCGIIIADTKFEFGIDGDGRMVLADEVLTPDSSRFWPRDQYRTGSNPPSLDKQYVRDWLDSVGFNHQPPAPELPPEVVAKTREKYLEAYRQITGGPLD